jgi:hypothetical protein
VELGAAEADAVAVTGRGADALAGAVAEVVAEACA